MSFADTLVRFEELLKEIDLYSGKVDWPARISPRVEEIKNLSYDYIDYIVQLGKVAEQMRSAGSSNTILEADEAYDKLMKGE